MSVLILISGKSPKYSIKKRIMMNLLLLFNLFFSSIILLLFCLLALVHVAVSEPVPINVNNPGPNDRVDILQMRMDTGGQGPGGLMRNALKSNAHNRWTKYRAGRSKYIIPFVISGSYNQNERAIIRRAMHSIDKHTCIRFRERRANEPDYVDIKNQGGQGCYTMVGMVRGHNLVMMESSPGATCIVFPTVVHELMHKIGLWHEQMRYDRDRHIEVLWNHIPQDLHSQFAKVPDSISTVFGVRYDYSSVMHYTKNAFARTPDMVTMRTLNQKYQNIIGTAQRASRGDWTKICAMYKCGRCMGKAFSKNRNNNSKRKRKGSNKTSRRNNRKRQRTEPLGVWMASNPQMVVGANGTATGNNNSSASASSSSSATSSLRNNNGSTSVNDGEDDEERRAVSDSDETSSVDADAEEEEEYDDEEEDDDQEMDEDDVDEEKVNDWDEEESEEEEETVKELEEEEKKVVENKEAADVAFDEKDDDKRNDDEDVEKMRRRKWKREEDKDWKENNVVENEEEEADDDEERRKR